MTTQATAIDEDAAAALRIYWECALGNVRFPDAWLAQLARGESIDDPRWPGCIHFDHPDFTMNTVHALTWDEMDCGFEVIDLIVWPLDATDAEEDEAKYRAGWEQFQQGLQAHAKDLVDVIPCGDCGRPVSYIEPEGDWFHSSTGAECFLSKPNPIIPRLANLGDLEPAFVEVLARHTMGDVIEVATGLPGKPAEKLARAIMEMRRC